MRLVQGTLGGETVHYSITTPIKHDLEYTTVFLMTKPDCDQKDLVPTQKLFGKCSEALVQWCIDHMHEKDWDLDLGHSRNFKILVIRTKTEKQQRMMRLVADLNGMQWYDQAAVKQLNDQGHS